MSELVTIIGEHMRVAGKLTGSEDLSVFGDVEGSIELTESLLIEPTGVVRAEVKVRSATISGVMIGNITAEEMVEITADGRMVGDIAAPRVILTDGAAFRGRIEMAGVEAAEQTPRANTRSARPTRSSARSHAPAPARSRPAPRAVAPRATPRALDPRPTPTSPTAKPRQTGTATATMTATVTEVTEVTEVAEAAESTHEADTRLSVAAFRELGWNKCRSYIKTLDANLEYSGFDELVEAYAAFLDSDT